MASEFPDGLEWSLEKVTGSAELEAEGNIYETAQSIQDTTSILPDYNTPDNDAPIGTSISGIVGALAVLLVCVGASYAFRFFRRKHE